LGRLGYAVWDKWLWYVTGGGGWVKFETNEFLISIPQTTGFTQTDLALGLDGGLRRQYALGYGWSIKSEFLYADFGRYTSFTSGPLTLGTLAPREVKVQDYLWRVGMNYKFGWAPALVARY
jgi:outer membrane immunogenic protein